MDAVFNVMWFGLSDGFWGALFGSLIAGIIAIIIMYRNLHYDRIVREIKTLESFLKSAYIIIKNGPGISDCLNRLEAKDYPQTEDHKKILISNINTSVIKISKLDENNIIFEAFEDFLKLKQVLNHANEAVYNESIGIYDPRYNGLIDYSSQIDELIFKTEKVYLVKKKRFNKLSKFV